MDSPPPRSMSPHSMSPGATASPSGSLSTSRKISYDKYGRSEAVIEWFINNVEDHRRLFSGDSKSTGKSRRPQKMPIYRKIAEAIFKNDPEESQSHARNPDWYAKSVENHIRSLKQKYDHYKQRLGRTGVGLRPEDVEPGSDMRNIIDQICAEFPQWPHLHGFWGPLPNFNPPLATPDISQELAIQAINQYTRQRHNYKGDGTNEEMESGEVSHTAPPNISLNVPVTGNGSAPADTTPSISPSSSLQGPGAHTPISRFSRGRFSRGSTISRGRSRLSSTSSPATPFSYSSSSARQLTLEEGGVVNRLAEKKLEESIAGHNAKYEKYKSITERERMRHELEMEKLKQHERLLPLQYEREREKERLILEREREKEAHELRILELRFRYREFNNFPGAQGNLLPNTSIMNTADLPDVSFNM